MRKVLVTRPADDAERLGLRLAQSGFVPVVAPLLSIEPYGVARPCPGGVGAIMLTSHNAVQVLRDRKDAVRDLFGRRAFCIGHRTAEAARAMGFRDVTTAEGGGRALAHIILEAMTPEDGPLLHPCGVDREETAGDILNAHGFDVRPWPVYKAEAVEALPLAVRETIMTQELDAVLFFSPRTASVFTDLVRREGIEVFCRRMTAIALSDAVASALRMVSFSRVLVAEAMSEESMLAALVAARDIDPRVAQAV